MGEGIRAGKNYVSDGYSHLMDFKVEQRSMGDAGSELKLEQSKTVRATARVAALLDKTPNPSLRDRPYQQKPYWHIERAREGDTREVPVELIMNGVPVAHQMIEADGKVREVTFDVPVAYSSWFAIRIYPVRIPTRFLLLSTTSPSGQAGAARNGASQAWISAGKTRSDSLLRKKWRMPSLPTNTPVRPTAS